MEERQKDASGVALSSTRVNAWALNRVKKRGKKTRIHFSWHASYFWFLFFFSLTSQCDYKDFFGKRVIPNMSQANDTQASGSGSQPRRSTQRDYAQVKAEKRKLRQDYRTLIGSTEGESYILSDDYNCICCSLNFFLTAEARSNLADHNPMELSQMIKRGTDLYAQGE